MKQLKSQPSAFNITLEPNDAHRLASVRGQFDDNLHLIEQRLNVEIRSRDNFFAVFGDEDDAKHAVDVIFNLYQETAHYSDVTPEEVHLHLRQFERPKPMDQSANSIQSVNDIDNFSIIRTKKGNIKAVSYSDKLKPQIEDWHKKFKVTEHVKMKSSLKFCVIASGEYDLYIAEPRACEWDIAAGHAILKHAGGLITDFENNEILYGKKDFKNPSLILKRSALL